MIVNLIGTKPGELQFLCQIKDTGCGMSSDFMDRMFQPFEREENRTSDNVQGTGLGLGIARSFTELMDGELQVESQLERQNILFDVDVKGGCSLKEYYGERALFIFVQAPSVEVLRERLIGRGDTSAEEIEKRISKAEYEMTFAKYADKVIVNDDLGKAKRDLLEIVEKFLDE